ncbi:hypothetical protein B9T66_06230 [Helicobacter sp. TUL]|uniref:hypothetical protein n=1 Tax=Helicobacter sp. TUL TaxID=1848928 RepID=UPI000BAB6901|nr:hypothetical protein [Helicobacter sp. TUL]PAU99652.1 hypothetical protein B9T66_06230 [Helicobacter sp. TUL]
METKISLLSKERLRSYDYDISKHYENLKLVGKITPKIATLEIILRNKLDQKLSESNRHWMEESNDENVINAREKIAQREHTQNLSHHQYLSRMNLGNVIYLIKENKIQNFMMNLDTINFKNYDQSNRNFFLRNNKKRNFGNIHKVDIVLSLLHNIRNRSYHWENILKTTEKNGKSYPRLTTKLEGTHIGINPRNIEMFLDDLIKVFDGEFLKYC